MIKFNKKLKESSRKWLVRHNKDIFVKKSLNEGRISRSSYKLEEINTKFDLLFTDAVIIDLGSAPGGWTQFAKQYTNSKAIIAVDLISMSEIQDVYFIQGDFLDKNIAIQIEERLNGKKIDLILSDMSPNTTGIKSVDHLRMINLAENILYFAQNNLSYNGSLVIKIFKGTDEERFITLLKIYFEKVKYYKPLSSRKESKEIYVVAMKYKY